MTTNTDNLKANLQNAIARLNSAESELLKRGLASRKSWGFWCEDTRHPRYAEYKAADSAYWNAYNAALEAGLITAHAHSFSWNA